MNVAIIGMGYVGLPLACLCAEEGIDIHGIDIDEDKVRAIRNGSCPVEDEVTERWLADSYEDIEVSTSYDAVADADVVVVTVPTPVRRGKEPDYSYVEAAMESIAAMINEDTVVVLESTVGPGTCRHVVKPILEESGFVVGEDVFLAYCPERVDPGNEEWTARTIPRVLGAYSEEGHEKAYAFYNRILDGEIFQVSSLEEAEASKVVENSFRDINIAFVNELAKSFDAIGIDTKEVIQAAATKPFGFMAHWPGCGVGGHCIPVDPYYLIEKAEDNDFAHEFLQLARDINNSMPAYTVQKVQDALNEAGTPLNGTKIGLLGLAYKAGVGDTRESPAFEIKKKLEEKGSVVQTFDPYVEASDAGSLDEVVERNDCLVIVTDHDAFHELEDHNLSGVEVVVDGRNMLDPSRIDARYTGIGR